MTAPISFVDAHERKHGPDPAHVYRDAKGDKWFEFTCDFKDGDETFAFSIWARDMADAERRLALLCQTAVVQGQIYAIVPA